MFYIYDFGDHWEHKITLEKINSGDCNWPKVTAGKGACPPEDCGGIWGYNHLVSLSKRPSLTEDDREHLEWFSMENGWDANAFDKQAVNELIKLATEI